MNNISQAIKVALTVRQYLKDNTGGPLPSSKEVIENYQRIAQQVKNVSGL